jgi:hypothetical protein
MELNYYQLIFTNGREYFVESEVSDVKAFRKLLASGGTFSKEEYIDLQLQGGDPTVISDPVGIKADKLFSVQKARTGVIGIQTKKWRLV